MFRKQKNKIIQASSHVKSTMAEYLSPLRSYISDKWKLKGKIRLLNIWAKRHPKRFMASFLVTMLCIFFLDVVITSAIKDNAKKGSLPMLIVSQNFDGMRKIENNRENIKSVFSKIVEDGNILIAELDSLKRIENKTREDSIAIINIANQLYNINKILPYEEN